MIKKNKLSFLGTLAKNDQEKTNFQRWYPWPKRLKKQNLSPLLALAKISQDYFFENE